ncbi:MAG: hypothetical protein L3J12_04140, partial [Spirochaetales bacterium]|nr:hypothetical protein [Spirochaetales bacterium]
MNEYRSIGVIGDQGVDFKIEAGKAWLRYNGDWHGIKNKVYSFTEEDVVVEEDGYSYIEAFLWEQSILCGSRFFLFLNDESSYYRFGIRTIGSFSGKDFTKESGNYLIDTLIKDISSTSHLIEASISYNPNMLTKYLGYFTYQSLPPMQVFNENVHPWVEGVDGPGIGEKLTISFTEPSGDIVVLNGFVDRNRKHLFKANNRVKTAIIRSEDSGEPFEFEYHFEDMVRVDEIRFPRTAEKVIFEIKDVYSGEKWDDTCISAVLTREPDPYKSIAASVEDKEVEEPVKKVYSPS